MSRCCFPEVQLFQSIGCPGVAQYFSRVFFNTPKKKTEEEWMAQRRCKRLCLKPGLSLWLYNGSLKRKKNKKKKPGTAGVAGQELECTDRNTCNFPWHLIILCLTHHGVLDEPHSTPLTQAKVGHNYMSSLTEINENTCKTRYSC